MRSVEECWAVSKERVSRESVLKYDQLFIRPDVELLAGVADCRYCVYIVPGLRAGTGY